MLLLELVSCYVKENVMPFHCANVCANAFSFCICICNGSVVNSPYYCTFFHHINIYVCVLFSYTLIHPLPHRMALLTLTLIIYPKQLAPIAPLACSLPFANRHMLG